MKYKLFGIMGTKFAKSDWVLKFDKELWHLEIIKLNIPKDTIITFFKGRNIWGEFDSKQLLIKTNKVNKVK